MSDCICVARGSGPEGCGLCNETGTRRVSPQPSPPIQGAVERVREMIHSTFIDEPDRPRFSPDEQTDLEALLSRIAVLESDMSTLADDAEEAVKLLSDYVLAAGGDEDHEWTVLHVTASIRNARSALQTQER